jgi:hypothetical protein
VARNRGVEQLTGGGHWVKFWRYTGRGGEWGIGELPGGEAMLMRALAGAGV